MPIAAPACRRIAGLSLVLAAVAAGPATQPIDKNTTEYTVAAVKARFRVPKFWQKREVNEHADTLFVFDPTPKQAKAPVATRQQLVEVYLNKPSAKQQTLADAVEDFKNAQLKRVPTLKFVKNVAGTFAGRKVWQLQWNERITLKTLDGKPAGFIELDRISYMWIEHDTLCQIGLHADTRLMPTLIGKAEPVARSVKWDD